MLGGSDDLGHKGVRKKNILESNSILLCNSSMTWNKINDSGKSHMLMKINVNGGLRFYYTHRE